MSDISITAMSGVVVASLATLERALDDITNHPKVALRIGIVEAETLSGATVRLMKLLDAAPDQQRDNQSPKSKIPATDIDDVVAVLERLKWGDQNGTCDECGGVVPPAS